MGGLATIAGGAICLLGVFSGWVTLGPAGDTVTDSGWSMTSGEGYLKSANPYVLVALAMASIAIGVVLLTGIARPVARIAAIVVGIGIVAAVTINWMSMASFVEDNFPTDFKADAAIGFYLAIAGGVVAAIGGALPSKR